MLPTRALPRGSAELPAVVEKVRRAVVSVVAGRAAEGPRRFSEHAGAAREHALGSGVIIEADGLVLTSRHVIVDADDVRVELADGRSFPGAVVARDAPLDVALIRMEGASGLPVAALGSSEALRVGDAVMAIGNPFGLGPSVTVGILSAAARAIDDGPQGRFLQTDAAVNPGDSGGPLLDMEGRVVGINTAVIEHGQGISFAVPIDDLRPVLRELQRTGRVARGHAGIAFQAVDAALARALGLPGPAGALVNAVDAPGPSQRAGVLPGDLILEADGSAIDRAEDLTGALNRKKPGEVVRFTVRRGACSRTVSVTLDRLPNRDGDAEDRSTRAHPARSSAGLRLGNASGGGARVEALDPASTAADGLHVGDVVVEIDHAPVLDAPDATRRLHLRPPPRTVLPMKPGAPHTHLLRIRREDAFLYVGIDIDRK